jgi:lysine-N-methylase
MNNIVKVDFYDDFSCIADKCSFSCCKGWKIIVDIDTYNKWKSDETQSEYLCKNVKFKKISMGTEYFIKMGNHMNCPFLDEKSLCNIVINHGEDYLPKTCKTFPRLENSFGNINEYSLSCACPAVVDIINVINGKMKFSFNFDENIKKNIPIEYNIREVMITILQNSKFSINDRILLIFNMLLFLKKQSVITKEIISRFQDEKYLCSLTAIWNGIEIDNEDSCRELNELFLDITENYKKEKNFRNYLKDISELAEDMEVESSQIKWHNMMVIF